MFENPFDVSIVCPVVVWINSACIYTSSTNMHRGIDNFGGSLASRIEFGARNESQICIFGHF